nr:hypothetical protein [Prevotella sp.]
MSWVRVPPSTLHQIEVKDFHFNNENPFFVLTNGGAADFGSADFPGWGIGSLRIKSYLCPMKQEELLRAILPDVLIDH